jgi:hypothetical protein
MTPAESRGIVALALFSLAAASMQTTAEDREPARAPLRAPVLTGELPPEIPESSGLVKSRKHAGVFWTHNDSGHKPALFAVRASGKVVATFLLPQTRQKDWEDISMDNRDRLVVADIGNNSRKRQTFSLLRVAEPDPTRPNRPVEPADVFTFQYPKSVKAVDAEALVTRGEAAYVFTKEPKTTRVFRIPLPESPPRKTIVAKQVGKTNRIGMCTGASLSANGRALALLNYVSVMVIQLSVPWPGTDKKDHKLFAGKWRQRPALLGQCEGIAWDGSSLVVTTEENRLLRKPGRIWTIHSAK